MYEELERKILKIAKDKNLLDKSKTKSLASMTVDLSMDLAQALEHNHKPHVEFLLGAILSTLIVHSGMNGVKLMECLLIASHKEIKQTSKKAEIAIVKTKQEK